MKERRNHPLICLLLLLALAACGDDDGGRTITPTITSPVSQSYVSGQVAITVEVEEPVSQLDLMVDNRLVDTLTEAPHTFTWDTTQATEGVHQLQVVASDAGGAQGASAVVSVMVDNTAPNLSVPDLEMPYVFSGIETIDVGASDDYGLVEVRFLVGGTLEDSLETGPFSFSFDTTGLPDRPVEISFEAEDRAGNVQIRTIAGLAVNDGTVVSFTDGSGVTEFDIPENWASVEVDKKFHWNMPSGVVEVLAALQWERAEWPFELAIGTGFCPHSGVKLAYEEASGGQVVTSHQASALGEISYDPEQWFVHLAPGQHLDMDANIGENTTVAFVAVLY